MLESDGIKCIDFDNTNFDDLRASIAANQSVKGRDSNQLKDQLLLWQELEKMKTERAEFKRLKEKLQRDMMNQTFESNLDMKEENQMLKEQEMVHTETISKYEKRTE